MIFGGEHKPDRCLLDVILVTVASEQVRLLASLFILHFIFALFDRLEQSFCRAKDLKTSVSGMEINCECDMYLVRV